MTFELRSPHPEVRERARAILGPWLAESPGAVGSRPARPAVRFAIDALGADGDRRWRVRRDGDVDVVTASSLDAALTAVEYEAVARLLAPDSGAAAVHAALVSREGRGLLIAGPKEAGKTTLACALWARGWSLHSDDTALLEGPRARGIPRRVSLRRTSRDLVGAELWDRAALQPGATHTGAGLLFHPRGARHVTALEGVPVEAVVFLARRGSRANGAALEPLDPGRGLLALAPYSNLRDPSIGRALEALQPLADRARFYDLGRGGPEEMFASLEAATRSS